MATAFPEIVDALRGLPGAALDCELVVPDQEGRSDFEASRRRSLMRRPRDVASSLISMPAVLIVFDVLEADGRDMRAPPVR
jgi:ATP-dependent DNA ligase